MHVCIISSYHQTQLSCTARKTRISLECHTHKHRVIFLTHLGYIRNSNKVVSQKNRSRAKTGSPEPLLAARIGPWTSFGSQKWSRGTSFGRTTLRMIVGRGISVTLRHFWIQSTHSSKLKNELPNVDYFQYCVCTPTQMKLTLTGWLFLREMNHFSIPNFAVNRVFLVTGWKSWVLQMLLVVGSQMSDGRLAALIGMLRSKSRIASSPADIWRAMQVCNTINNLWESKCKVKC